MVAAAQPLIHGQVPLAPLTTWRVGGTADWYAEPRTLADMQECLAWARSHHHPVTILGAGSNVLISDQGIPGLVINTRRYLGLQWPEPGRVQVAAGESLAKLARTVAQRGWSGLEWAVGIPGSLGGAIAMNAGAHGRSMNQVVVAVEILDGQHGHQMMRGDQLGFQYRSSLIQHRPWVVLAATLALEPGHEPESVLAQTQSHWERRRSTQPYDWPSCGSVFRNPLPHTAGWLIEQTGLKGYRLGGAEVSSKHANFILNKEHATATDLHHLILTIQAKVKDQWGIDLEPEVKRLGTF
ncbi:MAG: UDP-N-acetylmuramate dehydrogenase [Synechococcales cyanobacterium]